MLRMRPARGVSQAVKLSDAIGTYLEIEGVRVEKGKVGSQTLLVDTVNGKKLNEPISVWVQNLQLPSKKRCVIKGYESGEMIGVPPAEVAAARELGKTVTPTQAVWQWRPFFVALRVISPDNIKPLTASTR